MKKILIFSIAAIFVSCYTSKNVSIVEVQQDPSPLKSELYFNNCDSTLAFFKTIIINNNSDKNLKEGHFRIPFIKSSYKSAKTLFPENCFIGISAGELERIFGKGILEGEFATWYILQNTNNQLAIEVWIREGYVQKFKVGPSTIESINP